MESTCFRLLYDSLDYEIFIKSTLKIFRISPEYRLWLNNCNRNTCAATGLEKYGEGIEIEVHHYDLTLWQIVEHILYILIENEPSVNVNVFYVCLILNEIHMQEDRKSVV